MAFEEENVLMFEFEGGFDLMLWSMEEVDRCCKKAESRKVVGQFAERMRGSILKQRRQAGRSKLSTTSSHYL